MKCIIPGSNVKVFGRAVHCLSKIGDDLYMEPQDTGLALRAVNSSRSAYACFLFNPSFFLRYDDGSGMATQTSQADGETTRWRVTMKSCVAVFRSLYNLEKNVDRCSITLDAQDCRLVFQLHCRHGIVKTYNLVYQETEHLQAVYNKVCPNRITAPAKLLAEAVGSFQASQEELTLTVNPTQLGFRNYVDDVPDPSKVVHSELHLLPEEFAEYSIGVDTEVTFCLKELRAILSFSDAAGLPVSIHFETTGKPIVFGVESEQMVEATFVLATLADVSSSQLTSASQRSRISQPTPVTAQTGRAKPRAKSSAAHRKPAGGKGDARRTFTEHTNGFEEEEEFPDDLMMDILNQTERAANRKERDKSRTSSSPTLRQPSSVRDEDDEVTASPVIPFTDTALSHIFQKNTGGGGGGGGRDGGGGEAERRSGGDRHRDAGEEAEAGGSASPNRTFLANFLDENSREGSEEGADARRSQAATADGAGSRHGDDEDDNDDEGFDFIPGTPPSKKFKSMFFGASQSQQSQSSTQQSRPPPPSQQPRPSRGGGSVTVLVEDSDED